jgi:hypothetical protein
MSISLLEIPLAADAVIVGKRGHSLSVWSTMLHGGMKAL